MYYVKNVSVINEISKRNVSKKKKKKKKTSKLTIEIIY